VPSEPQIEDYYWFVFESQSNFRTWRQLLFLFQTFLQFLRQIDLFCDSVQGLCVNKCLLMKHFLNFLIDFMDLVLKIEVNGYESVSPHRSPTH